MKRKFTDIMLEMNAKLMADAAFVKFGQEALKLLQKPAEGALPAELLPLINSPLGKLMTAVGVCHISEVYATPGLDSVARAITAAAATDSVSALADLIAKCASRESAVLALPAPIAQNVSKGGNNKAQSSASGFLAVEQKAQEIKQNTTQGSETTVELTEQGADDDVPEVYWPVKPDELKKDANNEYVCPNPIEGKKPHSRQRSKFRPWVSKNMNGFRSDLDGLLLCGGCHVDLSTLYGVEKEKHEVEKKLIEAQAKIDALTEEFDALNDKIVKAQGTEATMLKMLTDDPSNEDFADSLKNVQAKIKMMQEQAKNIESQVEELDKLLDSKSSGNVQPAPVATNTAQSGSPTVVVVQANAKQPTGAAARIKGKHGK